MRALLAGLAVLLVLPAVAHARTQATGAPGRPTHWIAPDKHGFGTAAGADSDVWFSLSQDSLTQVFYPDVTHPDVRSLDVLVDGEKASGTATVVQSALAYTQTIATAHWRLVREYVTDPQRDSLVIQIEFVSLDDKARDLALAYDPQLTGDGSDDVGWTRGHALLAHDAHMAGALVARPAFKATMSGYAGHPLRPGADALTPGNVVQRAGFGAHQRFTATVALGFASTALAARSTATRSLDAGFPALAAAYVQGWEAYEQTLRPMPASALPFATGYETSLLVLKALEDKRTPGEFIAGPSTPKVRASDSYEIATALLAAGDTAAANAAVDYLFEHDTQAPLAVVLAWQLGRVDRWDGIKPLADALTAPSKDPDTEADQIAALVCAAGIARANHDEASAKGYEQRADRWAAAKPAAGALEFVRLGIKRAADVGLGSAQPTPGERGEYELQGGHPATAQLAQIAASINDGGMLGEPQTAPLAWAQAQFVRLAWSAEAGRPIEQPAIVAARYTSALSSAADLAPVAGFSFEEPTTLGARLSWPAETSGLQ